MKTQIEMTWDGRTLGGNERLASLIAEFPVAPDGTGWVMLDDGSRTVCIGQRKASLGFNGRGQIYAEGVRNCPCGIVTGVNGAGERVQFILAHVRQAPRAMVPAHVLLAPRAVVPAVVKQSAPFPFTVEAAAEDVKPYLARGIGEDRTGPFTARLAGWTQTDPAFGSEMRKAGDALFSLVRAARDGGDVAAKYAVAAELIDFPEI